MPFTALPPEGATPPPRWVRWVGEGGWARGWAILAIATLAILLCVRGFDRVIPAVDNGWAIYWPHDAIAAAILLMVPRRRWPWIVAGFVCAFAWVEVRSGEPPGEITIDIACNCAEVLIAAFALPAFRSVSQWLKEPGLSRLFTAAAIVVGPALTALPIGWYYSRYYPVSWWQPAMKWLLADALGAALWLPLTLVLLSRETYHLFRWRKLPETAVLLSCLCAITWGAFQQQRYPLSFLPYPFLLFVALRLGFSGAVIGMNLVTLIVTGLSVHNVGLFRLAGGSTDPQVVIIQLFSTLAVLFVFPLSVTLVERLSFERQLRQAYVDMKQLATIDQLTQVANRRHFDEVLDTEWARAMRTQSPLAMLMIDADYFKAYNDRYGHVAGDACLQQIAAALAAGVARRPDLVARYGGEEFAVLLPGMQPEFVEAFADELRAAVEALALEHASHPLGYVTLSIGCAVMVPAQASRAADLIDAADRALYAAKQRGRNCVVVAAK